MGNNWISIENELPDNNEYVVVFAGMTWFSSIYKNGEFFDQDGVDSYSYVTHFMRPQPPVELDL